jgi:hypothetical protein
VLDLRPNCECCDADLPPEATDALICTYECTWCYSCADRCLQHVCPNCGGNLQPRPIRPASRLIQDPASLMRVHQPSLHRSPG